MDDSLSSAPKCFDRARRHHEDTGISSSRDDVGSDTFVHGSQFSNCREIVVSRRSRKDLRITEALSSQTGAICLN